MKKNLIAGILAGAALALSSTAAQAATYDEAEMFNTGPLCKMLTHQHISVFAGAVYNEPREATLKRVIHTEGTKDLVMKMANDVWEEAKRDSSSSEISRIAMNFHLDCRDALNAE